MDHLERSKIFVFERIREDSLEKVLNEIKAENSPYMIDPNIDSRS